MDEREFIQMLRDRLKGIPEEELDDILSDYREHIAIGLKNGRSEEEIVASLGDPKMIAKQIRASYLVKKAEDTNLTGDVMRAAFAFLALSIFNMFIILGPFLSVVGILIALFAAAASIIVIGILAFFTSIFGSFNDFPITYDIHPAAGAFLSVGITAFGLLVMIGNWLLLKAFYDLTIKYLKMNIELINVRGDRT